MRLKRDMLTLGLGMLIVVLLSWNLVGNVSSLNSTDTGAVPADVPEAVQAVLSDHTLHGIDTSSAVSLAPEADFLALAAAEEQLLIHLYERVSPSVVYITVSTSGGFGSGAGSGFVLDAEGYIVTNNHVVEDADEILVRFVDDTTFEAELVATDPDSDLAVIRVDASPDLLKPVELGDSGALRVGQRAIAVGNPFGFEQTMTTGIVSALGRVVRQENGFSLPQMIQTDAAINPGNSGGPLLDSQGRVVGVNTLIFSSSGSSAGVGFAVPVDTVKRVVPALIATGRYADPWLGISGMTVTPAVAGALSLPVDRGVLLQRVVPGGPADQAALRGSDQFLEVEGVMMTSGGDILVALDGIQVRDMDDLIVLLAEKAVGQTVTMTILRDGEEQSVDVTLGERPAD